MEKYKSGGLFSINSLSHFCLKLGKGVQEQMFFIRPMPNKIWGFVKKDKITYLSFKCSIK